MTTPTYAPPFLQNPGGLQFGAGQQSPYGQSQPFGIDQFQQFGLGQQPFGVQAPGGQFSGVEQVISSIQVVAQLLGHAQQSLWTANYVMAQLPGYIATILQQQGQQRQFPRPYSMAW